MLSLRRLEDLAIGARRRSHELGAHRIGNRRLQDAIDLAHCGRIERPSECLVDGLQLAGVARSPQCRSRALVEDPAHRQMDDGLAVAPSGELIETPDCSEILRVAWRPKFRVGQAKVVTLKMRFY